MSETTQRSSALPAPYGRPLSQLCLRPYKSASTTRRDSQGYVWELQPEHPGSRKGYVPQHRLVAEHAIGRLLKGSEVVHHENNRTADNRLDNLWLFPSQAEHLRHHRWRESRAFEARARKALRGRTTAEAAEVLGVHHMTLRNKCPHLLERRASPGFLEVHREEIRSLATRLRNAELADRFGCHPTTMSHTIAAWAKAEPDAWLDAVAFRQSRRGIRWSRKRTAGNRCAREP